MVAITCLIFFNMNEFLDLLVFIQVLQIIVLNLENMGSTKVINKVGKFLVFLIDIVTFSLQYYNCSLLVRYPIM